MVFKRRRQASQVEQVIEVHPLITGRMQTAMLQGVVDPTLAAAGGGAWVAGRSGWVPSCRSNLFLCTKPHRHTSTTVPLRAWAGSPNLALSRAMAARHPNNPA
jgi:hypothetical protein